MLIFLLVIFHVENYAQTGCGTEASQLDIKLLDQLSQMKDGSRISTQADRIVNIPMTIHIIRLDNGAGGLLDEELNVSLDILNESFRPIKFRFYIEGEINYINDTDLYDFTIDQEQSMTSQNNVAGTVNIYFANSVATGESNVCGYTYFPADNRDVILMDKDCAVGTTLPHEFGHLFALYHTHGKTNLGTTDELVNGSNCETAGDDLCDTPADPNLSGQVNDNCIYLGSATDANGSRYDPYIKNIMSYSSDICTFQFTEGQYDRMVSAFNSFKSHLEVDLLSPDFSNTSRYICSEDSIVFTNNSNENYTGFLYEFDGGVPSSSSELNPVVKYNLEGTYDVKLTLYDAGGNEEVLVKEDFIVVETNENILSDAILSGSFEEEDILQNAIDIDGERTFSIASGISTEGSNSLRMSFYNFNDIGAIDYFILGSLNTETKKLFNIELDYAYAQYGPSNDELALVYRDECGSWIPIWEGVGSEIGDRDVRSLFSPGRSDWKKLKIQAQMPEVIDKVEFAIRTVNDFGNNLYIDNYKIYAAETTLSESDFALGENIVTNSSCNDANDGKIEIVVLGVGSFQFALNDGLYTSSNVFENLFPGTYSVKAKKVGEETILNQDFEVLFVNERPTKPEIVRVGDQLEVSLEDGQLVKWFLDDTLIEEESSSIAYEFGGTYVAEVTSGTCSSFSAPFLVLSEIEKSEFNLYPTLISEYLYLQANTEDDLNYKILNTSGQLILQGTYQLEGIDFRSVQSGVYLIKVNSEVVRVIKK